ncbi:SDR family NAD(P)-dependent oxidoreductase [Nocardiopsis sp. HNM0947]|uniref:SDR family NAD(P)-dependent oxidoreductase n=1 Tax=Nocardiopsis coralli TaxID=2772213 RepID=A0ABR9P888_9ACTN|nr:type I polyketide synthase [Nocardiopsis coralli]MBE3000046.1 SDR family NAD(P)-dependent oxidoreductase [Nocardiopsis coralli]
MRESSPPDTPADPRGSDGSPAGAARIQGFLVELLAELTGTDSAAVDIDLPFADHGLSSRDAVSVAGELEEETGRPLSPALLWEHPTVRTLVEALIGDAEAGPGPASVEGGDAADADDGLVAVVGVGCRFPGADGPEAFTELLASGTDRIRDVPPGRWDRYDDGSPETARLLAATSRRAGFLDDIEGFDAAFFRITPDEARVVDPQQRILLETALEALEHAALPPAAVAGTRAGVFVGASSTEYGHVTMGDLNGIEGWSAPGAALSVIANRLSYQLDLRGPSLTLGTACSSSLSAVHTALRSLRSGECDTALAGGVNVLLSPAVTVAFDRAGGTSPTGTCRPFDADADGMVRGEGCGVVVLKRLGDARRDGDRVLAVLRGSAVNSDGRSAGLVAPNPAAQRDVLTRACADAGVSPAEVGYVEAHGTGTPLGDPIEARALGAVMGRDRPAGDRLRVGSVKAGIGHLEAAAGSAGLIKAVVAVRDGVVPPTPNHRTPTPHVDWEAEGLEVVTRARPWPDRRRIAGVSSFGFGGTNAHVVVESPPEDLRDGARTPTGRERRGALHTFPVTDVSPERVRDHAGRLARWLDARAPATGAASEESAENHGAVLDDVARTLHRRAGRGGSGSAVVAADLDGLRTGLHGLAAGTAHPDVVTAPVRRGEQGPVWVFSGYGSGLSPDSVHALMDAEPAFADAVAELDPAMRRATGTGLLDALATAPDDLALSVAQPAVHTVQIALARLWRSYGVHPSAVVGHSMGEAAAAVAAGVLTEEEGLRVTAERSALLEQLVGGGAMLLAELSPEEADERARARTDVHVAVYSAPEQTVLTGDAAELEALAEECAAQGRLARLLDAPGAGHSPQVDPLMGPLRERLGDLVGREPAVPFYGTVHDTPRKAPACDADHWAANLRSPVRLTQAIEAAVADGHRAFTELSSHPLVAHSLTAVTGEDTVVTASMRRGTGGHREFHRSLARLVLAGHAPGHEPPGRIVDLPVPAWDRTPFPPPGRARARTAGAHPLLGTPTRLPGGERAVAEADVGTARLPWTAAGQGTVSGHAAGDAGSGPAVLTLGHVAEIALAAGVWEFGADAEDLEVTCVEMGSPLALGEHAPITTDIVPQGPGTVRVAVHARDAAGHWHEHATALVGEAAPVDGGGPLDGEGPADGAVLGEVAVPDDVPVDRAPRISPALITACLEAAAPPGTDEQRHLAVRAERVVFSERDAERAPDGSAAARVRFDPIRGDVDVLDGEGRSLARVEGVVWRSVRPDTVPAPLAEMLFDVEWEPAPLPSPAQSAHDGLGDGPLVLEFDAAGDLSPEEVVTAAVHGAHQALDSDRRLLFVARGGADAGPSRVALGGLRGLVRVLALEHPELAAAVVSVDGTDTTAAGADLRAEIAARAAGETDEDEVAWRDGARFAARLTRTHLERPRRPAAPLVRPGASYVLTGGYGGLGTAAARLLAERGAGRIVLNGRSGPSAEAAREIERLRESGCEAEVVLGDIADPGTAERLRNAATADGFPLRGVLHAAGVLRDRVVRDLSPDDVLGAFAPKVIGARNLHEATLHDDLDWWVAYSSAASLLGSPGQGAYAAASSCLDVLTAWRRSLGLPATTVDWGVWSGTGGAPTGAGLGVLRPFGVAQGLTALEAVLADGRTSVGVAGLRPARAAKVLPDLPRIPFFSRVIAAAEHTAPTSAEDLRALPPEEARDLVAERARERVAEVLGVPPQSLDRTLPLVEAGMDSLAAIRVKSVVEHEFGVALPTRDLLTGGTLAHAEAALCRQLGLPEAPEPDPGPGPDRATGEDGAGTPGPRDASERAVGRCVTEVLGFEPGIHDDLTHRTERSGPTDWRERLRPLLEAEAGSALDPATLFADPTVEGIAAVLRETDDPGSAGRPRVLQQGARQGHGTSDTPPPLFLAHPAGGTTWVYRGLARRLGAERTVLGLERFTDGASVEERARRYVRMVRQAQPSGPYRLGGWSFGGVLAHEAARQLTEEGAEVELVAMFDAGLPMDVGPERARQLSARRYADFAAHLERTHDRPVPVDPDELADLTEDAQLEVLLRAVDDSGVGKLLSPAILEHHRTSHEDTLALEAYRPGPHGGRTVLYRATRPTPWAVSDPRYDHPDEARGWDPHCPDLRIVRIDAHHLNLLDPPGVDAIARDLAPLLG